MSEVFLTPQLFYFGVVFAFLFGITIGSFLNVVIYRVPNNININFPPSHCPKCKHKLCALDLVPLFSYLFLGRKCRYCSDPISPRYFTIELITGLLFVATFLKFGWSIETVIYALFISALICVFMIDYDTYTIPFSLIIFTCALGIVRDIINIIIASQYAVGGIDPYLHIKVPFTGFSFPMLPSIWGIVICFVIFLCITLFSMLFRKEGGMGGGDTLLACAIGSVLTNTTYGLWQPVASFFIAIFLGAIVGVIIIIVASVKGKNEVSEKERKLKEELEFSDEENNDILMKPIPFGPYMVTGALFVMFFFNLIIKAWDWYYISFIIPKP